jgi:hypothetical protein
MIAGMVGIGGAIREGKMHRERGEVSSNRQGERQKIKGNQIKNRARTFGPGGRLMGEGDLRPPQFLAGGVRTPPAAGCGLRRSPALPRPEHGAVGKVAFEDASELSVGQLEGILLFRTVIAGGRLRSSSRPHVRHCISVHYRTFCVELPILHEW